MSQPPKGNALPISIFPFLDVLVCTMGSLILILILISARIRSQPAESADTQTPEATSTEMPGDVTEDVPGDEPPADLPTDERPFDESPSMSAPSEGPLASAEGPSLPPLTVPSEDLVARTSDPDPEPADAEQPEPERAELAPAPPDGPTPRDRERELRGKIAELSVRLDAERAALNTKRQEVAAARRRALEAQAALRSVQAKIAEMIEGVEQNDAERQKLLEERERLERELAELNQRIRRSKEQSHDAASKFAFVPYDGVSGTTRRPILVECTSGGLRFIPEDVAVKPGDIAGFTEKVNPLLAGATALSRYWSTVDGLNAADGEAPEPYVLLIVRPSGTIAFYYAQKMLSKMKHSFGYELLDDERELAIPPADPKARALCQAAVAELLAKRDKSGQSEAEGSLTDGFPSPGGSEFRTGRVGGAGSGGVAAGGGPRVGDAVGLRPGTLPGGTAGGEGADDAGSSGRSDGSSLSGRTGGTSAGTAGTDRRMRFRPGVGFEEEEPEPGAKVDDPFARALREREQAFGTGGKRGSGDSFGTGSGAPRAGASRTATGVASDATPKPRGTLEGTGDGAADGGSGAPGGRSTSRGGLQNGQPNAKGTISEGEPGTTNATDAAGATAGSDTTRGTRSPATGSSRASNGGGGRSEKLPTDGAEGTGASAAGGRKDAKTAGAGTPGGGMAGGGNAGGGSAGSGDSGAKGGARGDEELAGPGPSFKLPSKTNDDRPPTNRRWGYYSRRASIGFQREIRVVATADRLVLGKDHLVPLEEGASPRDVVEAVTVAVEAEVRSWGRPPDSFYYVPTLNFVVEPGAEQTVESLRVPLQREGLKSSAKPAVAPEPRKPKGVLNSGDEPEWRASPPKAKSDRSSPARSGEPASGRPLPRATEARDGAPPS